MATEAKARELTCEEKLEMADGCLAMIHAMLERILGEGELDSTPPMMYPEAIMSACYQVAKVAAETGDPHVSLPLAERTADTQEAS